MVRRYNVVEDDDGTSNMVERTNGDWVLADDYDDLVKERDELKIIIADAIERLREA